MTDFIKRIKGIEENLSESDAKEVLFLEVLPILEDLAAQVSSNKSEIEDLASIQLDDRIWPLVRNVYQFLLQHIVSNEALPEEVRGTAYQLSLECYAVENGITFEAALEQAQKEAEQLQAQNV
jgi:hypothetical protein